MRQLNYSGRFLLATLNSAPGRFPLDSAGMINFKVAVVHILFFFFPKLGCRLASTTSTEMNRVLTLFFPLYIILIPNLKCKIIQTEVPCFHYQSIHLNIVIIVNENSSKHFKYRQYETNTEFKSLESLIFALSFS